ncbi:MAG: GGDEF domain-containing protein [Deltaproteobacteria bacterium]|nr:GGDEF domain-containing protein [Sandaracinaceae bacterium]MCX7807906.1 GGDEF domain-containing protein [Deltaproteobacteria bacterium]
MSSDERSTDPEHTVVTTIVPALREDKKQAREGCLVIIYGAELGRRIPLNSESILIGRSSKCDVQIEQESVSRTHLRIQRLGGNYIATDLGSTNGTYINDVKIVGDVILRDGDQIKVGQTIFKFISGDNIESAYYEEIYNVMTTDGLTGLHNKRFFDEALEREIQRSKRYERIFSLLLFDVDHFKRINDTYGHLAGDAVLRQLGSLLRARVRKTDVPARIGGEEFAVLVPEVPLSGAFSMAEKLRKSVEENCFSFESQRIPVTISIGVAEWNPKVRSGEELIATADQKLYEAKRRGRNQVVV